MRTAYALLLITFLTGCTGQHWTRESPLPTPTTVTANLLPVEVLRQLSVCEELGTDYQLFFLKSEADWNDLLLQLSTKERSFVVDGADAVKLTDFQNQRLLLALRTCHTSSQYTVAIDRVVQISNDQLFVYLELRDPGNGSYKDTEANGYYQFASIPWPKENADEPDVEVVAYTVFLMYGQPVE